MNDYRRYIALSTFGFYKGGVLEVKLENFHVDDFNDNYMFGFSLDRTVSDAMNPYLDNHQETCLLQKTISRDSNNNGAILYFILDFKQSLLRVNCSKDLKNVRIYKDRSQLPTMRAKRDKVSDTTLFGQRRKRDTVAPDHSEESAENLIANTPEASIVPADSCSQVKLPITFSTVNNQNFYNTSFLIHIASVEDEGLYNLYFHSCRNYQQDPVAMDFVIEIQETNRNNYLSAGEMPLPALYLMMSILFFLSGSFWVHPVFKIHYLMAVLVYLKSLSLLFHSINYHFIEISGTHVAAWAVLYYVTHLLKGAVLFITIILIGTGWTFVKHILSEKDKKIFMIVIPLQVLANVAEIIIEESEEGDLEYHTWRDVFILVDLLCCGAILFPVVWSIRHLQEASHTDGKAAMNLRKLKVFRHFYIMIVCYIYFTRIIVYLLKITVPFQYEWLDEMFREMATYVFFVLTGYNVTQSGLTEGLTNLARMKATGCDAAEEEEKDNLLSKRESSHEYD
ncbi:hypothetical protein B566_EDAN002275 [Ephemera danica]|nr:hypothetical protein B566_EDAN002275 [Ephemera danica]